MEENTTFYTVQDTSNALRLYQNGEPWPTTPDRAALGEGVYAWSTLAEAEEYKRRLVQVALNISGVEPELQILTFKIANSRLSAFRSLYVDQLPEPEAWMQLHSKLWGGIPDDGLYYDYIQRETAIGREHFFHKAIFEYLEFE